MRIIPVIDLMAGKVVRAVGGKRSDYRPLKSVLADSSNPHAVARALSELGFRQAYLADLDAIAGQEPSFETYDAIARIPLDLMVDAGLGDRRRLARLFDACLAGRFSSLILGLESIADPDVIAPEVISAACAACGPDRVVFSLDLRDGRPIAHLSCWQDLSSDAIVAAAIERGIRRVIVLDLARVGSGQGAGSEALCKRLRRRFADIELIAGGGVRNASDLAALEDAGCDAALVGSALYDGTLTASMLTASGARAFR